MSHGSHEEVSVTRASANAAGRHDNLMADGPDMSDSGSYNDHALSMQNQTANRTKSLGGVINKLKVCRALEMDPRFHPLFRKRPTPPTLRY